MANARARADSRVIHAISVDIADVFIGAVRLDFDALHAVTVVSGSAHALVAVKCLVELTVGDGVAVVDDIA